MKKSITALLNVAAAALACIMTPAFTSCSEEAAEPAVPETVDTLTINGNCDIYEIGSKEAAAWTVKSAPAWITPVKTEGAPGDKLQIYVESNIRGTREGEIVIVYKNGKSRSVAITQSTETTTTANDSITTIMQRTYAVGWSFDVRTYMDFRGLKEQVFNTQKLQNYDKNMYRIEKNTNSHLDFYYGESSSELSDDMNAKLKIDGKFNSFSLDLQGSFGKSALSDSKRIFSKIRCVYNERLVYLNQLDLGDAQDENLFTVDFAAERQHVIDSEGSDESIRKLIDRYGTHLVIRAWLGGFYDYYFSSIVENASDLLNVEAALKLGFAEKFKLEGDAKYKDDFNRLSTQRIEKFSVKGGDAISLSMAVEDGTISEKVTEKWLKSLTEANKYELVSFRLVPISELFPDDIMEKIDDYTDRMYYREIPVTRSVE